MMSSAPSIPELAAITALCRIDGGTLPQTGLAVLGLAAGPTSFAGPSSFAGFAVDPAMPAFADSLISADRATLVLGKPEGTAAKACGGSLAVTMRGLLDAHGADLPARVEGEWAMLDWSPGRLRLIQSRQRRDWLFYARRGGTIALCGDLDQISRLDGVGRDLDPLSFAGSFGRGPLRAALRRETILPGVFRLRCGEHIEFTAGGERSTLATLPEARRWQGSFDEAVEEARALLVAILREKLDGLNAPALMLSGGLDSSTLAALLRTALGPDADLLALTSAAPAGSGLPDERGEAEAVVKRLGLKHKLVTPDPHADAYRPDPEAFRLAGGPTLSPRHYLYRALTAAAQEHGADMLFDGAFGELTVTSYTPLATPRYRLRQALKRMAGRGEVQPGSPFHARLAPHRRAALASRVDELVRGQSSTMPALDPRGPWGWHPGHDKVVEPPSLLDLGMRTCAPFRDSRLLHLFAGFPASYIARDGLSRAPARAMMAGLLPEEIRLRRTTGAFSPDYMRRLREQAPAALARMPEFRRVEAEDWFDLAWLEGALQRVSAAGPQSIPEAFEVQMTCMAAEFLVWWRRD